MARFPQFQILLFNLTYLTYNHVQRGRGGSSIFGLNRMWFLESFYLEFSHFTRHFTFYILRTFISIMLSVLHDPHQEYFRKTQVQGNSRVEIDRVIIGQLLEKYK